MPQRRRREIITVKDGEDEMTDWVDIHTHHRGNGIYILDISDGKIPQEGELCSMGIHPLYFPDDSYPEKMEKAAASGTIVAIGESGLDRNSAVAMDKQLELFALQIAWSEKYRLPLIIHCVRAFPELLSCYKKYKPVQAWIVHGYNNNCEILNELCRHGLYISAGKKLFVEHSNIRQFLPLIPSDRLFIETDDSTYAVEQVYREAASVLHTNVEQLKVMVYNNFTRVFRT